MIEELMSTEAEEETLDEGDSPLVSPSFGYFSHIQHCRECQTHPLCTLGEALLNIAMAHDTRV
jgi:hypothetical protein